VNGKILYKGSASRDLSCYLYKISRRFEIEPRSSCSRSRTSSPHPYSAKNKRTAYVMIYQAHHNLQLLGRVPLKCKGKVIISDIFFFFIKSVLRIRDVYPDPRSEFFPSWIRDPWSKRFRITDTGPHQRIQVFLTPKNVSKPSEI
jgi:hypothetical protein